MSFPANFFRNFLLHQLALLIFAFQLESYRFGSGSAALAIFGLVFGHDVGSDERKSSFMRLVASQVCSDVVSTLKIMDQHIIFRFVFILGIDFFMCRYLNIKPKKP